LKTRFFVAITILEAASGLEQVVRVRAVGILDVARAEAFLFEAEFSIKADRWGVGRNGGAYKGRRRLQHPSS